MLNQMVVLFSVFLRRLSPDGVQERRGKKPDDRFHLRVITLDDFKRLMIAG